VVKHSPLNFNGRDATTFEGRVMAYMGKERKAELMPGIKAVLRKYNRKATISVFNHSTLVAKVKGPVTNGDPFIDELRSAMNVGNFDKSDLMTDYYHVGGYVYIQEAKL
jgi:hypothetical protein